MTAKEMTTANNVALVRELGNAIEILCHAKAGHVEGKVLEHCDEAIIAAAQCIEAIARMPMQS